MNTESQFLQQHLHQCPSEVKHSFLMFETAAGKQLHNSSSADGIDEDRV